VQTSAGKVLASIVWDQDASSSLIIFQRVNYQHGLISANAIEGHFEAKSPRRGMVNNWVLLLHDNAPAHRALATQNKLAYLGLQFLDHAPYFTDLAPSDYHLFPGLKKQLNGRYFSTDMFIAAAETWLDGQPSDFF
jgi:hypothetical protein